MDRCTRRIKKQSEHNHTLGEVMSLFVGGIVVGIVLGSLLDPITFDREDKE